MMKVGCKGFLRLMMLLLALTMTACGGGGGGGSEESGGIDSLQYTGNEDPAVMDATNIEALTKGAMGLNLMPVESEPMSILPSALSRSLSVTGMTGTAVENPAVQSMVSALSDGLSRSAIGEAVGEGVRELLSEVLLDELANRLSEPEFPDSGDVTISGWSYDAASDRYTITITLTDVSHCSEWSGETTCVDRFNADGTLAVTMALSEDPRLLNPPLTLPQLIDLFRSNDSEYQRVVVSGIFSGADEDAGATMNISGELVNEFSSYADESSNGETYAGRFEGDIVLNEENAIALQATGCTLQSNSNYSDVEGDREGASQTDLAGNVHLVLTEIDEVAGESTVVTVDVASGNFAVEETNAYKTVTFHGMQQGLPLESVSLLCSGQVTASAKRVAGEVESGIFDLDLTLGRLAFTSESSTAVNGDDLQFGNLLALELQASLHFITDGASFRLDDLDLDFEMNGTETNRYNESGEYLGFEGADAVSASLSGSLEMVEGDETVFAISAPRLGDLPNMTLSVENSRSYLDEESTYQNTMNLHVGRLSITDRGATYLFGGDFDFSQNETDGQASLSLVATNPAGVTTFIDNYRMTLTPGAEPYETQVAVTSGTFYHSVYGSVSVATGLPFTFLEGGWPVAGDLIVTASNGVAGRLEAQAGQYQVLGDMDGNGEFDGEGDYIGSPEDWPMAPWDMVMSLIPLGMPR